MKFFLNVKFSLSVLFFLFFFGCASRPVSVHSTRQQPKPVQTKAPVKKGAETSTPTKVDVPAAAKTPAVPVVDLKIVPKVKTPESLLSSVNNMREANDLIENKLSLNELEAAAADPTLEQFKPQLLLKIGKTYQKNKEPDRAGEYYRALSTLYPQSVYATQASVLLTSLHSSAAFGSVDPKVIGAVLPLTGRSAGIGQHALNAIRLGLGLNKPNPEFRLALFDSQGDADLAVQGVDKLINEDKAIAIIGGFSAKEATAIAARSELLSVPFIGFSQKPGLTQTGEYVFRNAITPEMQVEKLVQFAFEKLSAKKFAILYPDDSYGQEFSNAFWDQVVLKGGQVTAAQSYDPKTTDFTEVVQKMVGTYYTEARAEELKERLKEIKAAKKAAAQKNKNQTTQTTRSQRDSLSDPNVLPPIIDFDVVFVPDTSRALGQILAFMKFNEVVDMNYLGTNLWNSADLPKRAANEDAAIYFVEAIDISVDANTSSGFHKEYFEAYNEAPTLVEIQAYEASKILAEQINSGNTNRDSLASSLRSLGRTEAGVTGELEMSKNRELLRPLHVMMLDSGLVKKAD